MDAGKYFVGLFTSFTVSHVSSANLVPNGCVERPILQYPVALTLCTMVLREKIIAIVRCCQLNARVCVCITSVVFTAVPCGSTRVVLAASPRVGWQSKEKDVLFFFLPVEIAVPKLPKCSLCTTCTCSILLRATLSFVQLKRLLFFSRWSPTGLLFLVFVSPPHIFVTLFQMMLQIQSVAIVAASCIAGALARYEPTGVGKDMLSYKHGPGMWSSEEGCCREEVGVINPNPYYNWPQEGYFSTRISRDDAETVWIGISGEYLREDQMRLKEKFGVAGKVTPHEMCKALCTQEMGKKSTTVDVGNPSLLPMNDAFGNRIPSERTCSGFEVTKIKKAWKKTFTCGEETENKWCIWLGNAQKKFTRYDGGFKCELHTSPVNAVQMDSRACKRATCTTAEVAFGHMYVPPFADEAFQAPFVGEDALNRVDDPNAFKGSLVIAVPFGFPECHPTIKPGNVYSAGPGNLSTHGVSHVVEGSYSVENLSPHLRRITRNDNTNLTSWNESFVVVCGPGDDAADEAAAEE